MPKKPKKTVKPAEVVEHGPETACYDNVRIPGQQTPTIFCLCGERLAADTWEDTGYLLDEHLADVEMESKPMSKELSPGRKEARKP